MSTSVVIPTMASPQRAAMLRRAIESVRRSSASPIRIIVVVNGNRYDADTCVWLKAQSDVTFELIDTPSLPKALRRGVEMVETAYFSTLDDDDEYVGLATDAKQKLLAADDNLALVVTNGFRNQGGTDQVCYEQLEAVPQDPLNCLMRANWLASCNALYRRSEIGLEFFDDIHPFAEWTWLAYKIAHAEKRIAVLDEITFRINDTIGSLSKSPAFSDSYISLFRKMLEMRPPSAVRRLIQRKLAAAYHDASHSALNRGSWINAFKWHMQSLLQPSGLSYLPYSRYFLMPSKFRKPAKPQ